MHYRYHKLLCLLFCCFISTIVQGKESKNLALGVSINIEVYDALNSRNQYQGQMVMIDGVVTELAIGGIYTFKDKSGSIILHTDNDFKALNYSLTTKKAVYVYGYIDTTTTPNSINVIEAQKIQ